MGGSYDIRYDDGDKETQVARKLIEAACGDDASSSKAEGSPQKKTAGETKKEKNGKEEEKKKKKKESGSSGAGAKLSEGDAVEARHGGQAQWFPGKVGAAHANGTYDVRYDDGDEEKKVPRHRVRRKGEKPRRVLSEGEVVDARHGGGKKLFPGKITNVRDDGSYDIRY